MRALGLRSKGLVICLAGATSLTCPAVNRGDTWRQHTFEDFRKGHADDGGVNLYAAADGTVRTVYTFDYNRDGHNDVLYVCSHDNWYAPPTYIYMNDRGRFDSKFRWLLLDNGASAGTLADLNEDGWPEAVLCGTHNGQNFSALDAIVYDGGPQGYARRRSQRLPTYHSESVVAVDWDRDGDRDLVFAQSRAPGLIVYDNVEGRFDTCRQTALDCGAVSCCRAADVNSDGREDLLALSGSRLLVYPASAERPAHEIDVVGSGRFAVADLDDDGHLDVIVANKVGPGRVDVEVARGVKQWAQIFIYWGDSDGEFAARPPTGLPCHSSRDVAAVDLNGDGWLDVVVANFGSDDADGNAPTTVYWGGREGFDPARKLDLNTRFAHGLAIADVDRNGWPDVVVACNRNATSHNVPSYVYLNESGTLSEEKRIPLPTLGAVSVVTGDVDRNAWMDLMFLNFVDGTKGISNARLYWNDGQGGFSTERITRLPIHDAFSHVATDLNLDGQIDIVFANSYEYGRWRDRGSPIYWGDTKGKWSVENQSLVPTSFATGVVTADLNRDGWLDLAFAQLTTWEEGYKAEDRRQPVFYGSEHGFNEEPDALLPVEDPRGLTAADLNKDGWIDLIYSNLSYEDMPIFWGSPDGYSPDRKTSIKLPDKGCVTVNCADANNDGWLDVLAVGHYHYGESRERSTDRYSHLFWGSPEGFDTHRRVDLPGMGAQGSCFADFDGNGLLDLFLPSYSNGHINRTWTSFLYYNGPEGYSPARRTGLLTDSGSGALALDFNHDGWLDLAVACHARPDGNHRADSFVFYGGENGFSDYRKTSLPTEGSHDMTNMDAGHQYHRRFEFVYTSGVHDAGRKAEVSTISWMAESPSGSQLRFQIRAADDAAGLSQATWVGAKGTGSFIERPGDLRGATVQGRFTQYRASFTSRDGSNYPVLHEVKLELDPVGRGGS